MQVSIHNGTHRDVPQQLLSQVHVNAPAEQNSRWRCLGLWKCRGEHGHSSAHISMSRPSNRNVR